jgi:hypothetical protein
MDYRVTDGEGQSGEQWSAIGDQGVISEMGRLARTSEIKRTRPRRNGEAFQVAIDVDQCPAGAL